MRQLWNAWSYWSRGPRTEAGDFINHAVEETEDGAFGAKTICGITRGDRWDTGLVMIPQEGEVGCKKCRKIIEALTTRTKFKAKGKG